MDSPPATTPSVDPLERAVRSGRFASELGFDWRSVPPVLDAVRAELDELEEAWRSGERDAVTHELGDVLLAACNVARHLALAPGPALDLATARFERRFEALRARLEEEGRRITEVTDVELERRWQDAKRAVRREP